MTKLNPDPNFLRECSECHQQLTQDNFFINPNGHLFPRCKICHKKFQNERNCAIKAGRRLNKKGKPISGSKSQAKNQSNAVTPSNRKLSPAKRTYMSQVNRNATEMISDIRDAAFNMAEALAKTHNIEELSPKDAYQIAISLKSLNDIVLTNNLFLKNNIDLSTLTDEELIQLADAMKTKGEDLKAKGEAIEVEVAK